MKVPILIPNIFNHPFTYDSSNLKLKTGDYVIVPFGKTQKVGIVWNEFQQNIDKKFSIKKVIKKINIESLNEKTIKFFNWFSEYNLIPKGMILKLHLLSGKAIENYSEDNYKLYKPISYKKLFNLSNEQKKTLLEINKLSDNFRVHVLQGTTGSGKTIVYFSSLKKKLDKGYQGLILLPEIGLTSDFQKKFKDFFGFEAAIWHSAITKKKKEIIWSGISSGKIKVIIGARSSLFLPFKKLGLIIVDEEHDQSYKQDEGVIYNARDMAISRALFENIPINLITSVPSVETYYNIKKGKYSLSRLLKRYKDAKLPNYEIIDLKKFKLNKGSWISKETIKKVENHLKKDDQILFFINRRGFSPFVFCNKCFKVFSCPNCSINLVYHKSNNVLRCHYCGHSSKLNRSCLENQKCDFVFNGPGVEKIMEEIKNIFPDKKSIIFSSDTMNKKSSTDILENIIKNDINILVGTQLISKGFHFPSLNCIVVVDLDLTLNGHDLRGPEKNLQLYHQLSGRAGRAGKPATVYFQTYSLNSKIISQITNKDPFLFLENELLIRKKNNLPPFERFISLILIGENDKKLEKISIHFRDHLQKYLKAKILGPINAPIYKMKKKFRMRLLIRAKKNYKIQKALSESIKKFKLESGIKLIVDIDPISFN